MNGHIPKDPAWCRFCLKEDGTSEEKPCRDHKNGEYNGYDVYEPSSWVLQVIGTQYQAWDGRTYLCFGYDPRCGFWMRTVDEPVRITNVSERAIGRTFHVVGDRT